jgi:hypothetical protein
MLESKRSSVVKNSDKDNDNFNLPKSNSNVQSIKPIS